MAGTAAWTGGMLFSLVVGALASIIGYNPLFASLAAFDLLATLIAWCLIGKHLAVSAISPSPPV
ncbi:MAG: hypothetical protein KGQ94_04385 [Alphaproteobacteria bacterium]|nr:hypothetical protein [Alphaproteobacteria bacterium]